MEGAMTSTTVVTLTLHDSTGEVCCIILYQPVGGHPIVKMKQGKIEAHNRNFLQEVMHGNKTGKN
jgi:hypothetical protein